MSRGIQIYECSFPMLTRTDFSVPARVVVVGQPPRVDDDGVATRRDACDGRAERGGAEHGVFAAHSLEDGGLLDGEGSRGDPA